MHWKVWIIFSGALIGCSESERDSTNTPQTIPPVQQTSLIDQAKHRSGESPAKSLIVKSAWSVNDEIWQGEVNFEDNHV